MSGKSSKVQSSGSTRNTEGKSSSSPSLSSSLPSSRRFPSILSIVCHVFVFWLLSYVYSCTPRRWTSVKRVIQETTNRALQPLMTFNPLISIDGTLFDLDPKELLPLESPPSVVIMPKGTPKDVAYRTFKAAWDKQDTIVVWKGVVGGTMNNYRDEAFLRRTLNNDNYTFLHNFSNYQSLTLPLHEAFDIMDDLYLGFSYNVLQNNPNTLWKDFNSFMQTLGPDLQNMVPVNRSLHHVFVYKGRKYHTGAHQAPASDWFFQVSNSKTWRFIHPHYTPYMKPITFDGISLMSAYDFISPDAGIPYIDVTTDAGDMLFFPAHWWHEVHNNEDGVGIAFGFRPKSDMAFAIFDVLFPLKAADSIPSHRITVLSGLLKSGITKLLSRLAPPTTVNDDSGLKGRQGVMRNAVQEIRKYVPTWDWDRLSGQPEWEKYCVSE
jgi:uncharacterized protein YggT (Ycf19 family)